MSLMRMPSISSFPSSPGNRNVGKKHGLTFHGPHSHRQQHVSAPASGSEFSLRETHGLMQMRDATVLKSSAGLGWSNAYISVQTQGPFSARLDGATGLLIAVINSGTARAKFGWRGSDLQLAKEIEAAPGSICIIPDGQAFDCELKSRVGWTQLYIRRSLLDRIAGELSQSLNGRVEITPRIAIFDPVLEQLINAVRDALDERPDLSGLYVDYLLGAIAARLIRNHSNVANESRPYAQQERLNARLIERTRRIVEDRLAERLSTADLAQGTGIGADQFGRLFKQASGISLYQFVIRARVDRACRLLTETRMPIVEIALDCGFADQVHLTRAFARIVGTTPAAYRKERRN